LGKDGGESGRGETVWIREARRKMSFSANPAQGLSDEQCHLDGETWALLDAKKWASVLFL
jgi:hypothetical protein